MAVKKKWCGRSLPPHRETIRPSRNGKTDFCSSGSDLSGNTILLIFSLFYQKRQPRLFGSEGFRKKSCFTCHGRGCGALQAGQTARKISRYFCRCIDQEKRHPACAGSVAPPQSP